MNHLYRGAALAALGVIAACTGSAAFPDGLPAAADVPEGPPAQGQPDAGATDVGATSDADVGAEAFTQEDGDTDASKDPNQWAYVYLRYFGPGTAGHCGNAGCHDQMRSGFHCGTTRDACYAGLIDKGLIDLAHTSDSILVNPAQTPLAWFGGAGSQAVDGTPVPGKMPADQAVVNEEAAGAVLHWVRAGARNDGYDPDAGASDAATGYDAGAEDSGADGGGEITWTYVYNRYFGTGTPGHCGKSGCHRVLNTGFKCGTTKNTCWNGLVAKGLIDTAAPAKSLLMDASQSPVAWFNPKGPMPLDNDVPNAQASADVRQWILAGAKNN
jgi:hypothetical protein